jgi:hypothetical protein
MSTPPARTWSNYARPVGPTVWVRVSASDPPRTAAGPTDASVRDPPQNSPKQTCHPDNTRSKPLASGPKNHGESWALRHVSEGGRLCPRRTILFCFVFLGVHMPVKYGFFREKYVCIFLYKIDTHIYIYMSIHSYKYMNTYSIYMNIFKRLGWLDFEIHKVDYQECFIIDKYVVYHWKNN